MPPYTLEWPLNSHLLSFIQLHAFVDINLELFTISLVFLILSYLLWAFPFGSSHVYPSWPGRCLPKSFADHVLVRDAIVGQILTPHGVERVVQSLGSQFIGLKYREANIMIDLHHSQLILQVSALLKCRQNNITENVQNLPSLINICHHTDIRRHCLKHKLWMKGCQKLHTQTAQCIYLKWQA